MDEDKAFDAVESYLRETESEPSSEWRTVSLVTALLGIVSHGPEFQKPTPEARREAFKAAGDELSRRGLDGLGLVRYGMRAEVVAPLLSSLIVRLFFNGTMDADRGIEVDRWCAVLNLQPPARNNDTHAIPFEWFAEVLMPALPQLDQWVASASLDEIVNLTPPSPEDQAWLPAVESVDRSLGEQYRWAVDHFAKTYFRDWNTTSLHYELRWLDGDILPPCPNELMLDRRVSREEITQEIARRAVYNERPDPGESLVLEMSKHAIKLLRQGRYREAAAVFEFGVQQRPGDPEVRNNLGFCLIPVEPREALEHLKSAANMGYNDSGTNAYNQMCCYLAVGRSRAALNVADLESHRPNHISKDVLLWRQSNDGSWAMFESDYPFRSVARFATEIARIEGWKDQEEHWAEISEQLAKQSVGPKLEETNEIPHQND